MTETEWLEADEPAEMLGLLMGKASDKKLRLFACECARRVHRLGAYGSVAQEIALVERFIEGNATAEDLAAARRDVIHRPDGDTSPAVNQVLEAVLDPNAWNGARAAGRVVVDLVAFLAGNVKGDIAGACADEEMRQVVLLHDLFGNPYRPVRPDARWLSVDVVDLAEAIHEDRAFDRMPILGDALMDAGCDSVQIIEHCRNGREHVRGCWVIDLLLGMK